MEKVFKPQINKISLSTPFLTRTRCKYCAEFPTLYYYIRDLYLWFDPNKVIRNPWIDFLRKYISRFVTDFYLLEDPKDIKTVTIFTFKPENKYNPKLHKNKGVKSVDNKVEFLTCKCGKSTWAFTDKAVVNRPEIVNRKSHKRFPKKIDSY